MKNHWSFALSVGLSILFLATLALFAIQQPASTLATPRSGSGNHPAALPETSNTTTLSAQELSPIQQTRLQSVTSALDWLASQQNDNGSSGDSVGATIDSLLAYAAANEHDLPVSNAGNTPLDYLQAEGNTYASQGAAQACKLALGVSAAGLDPRDFHGINLVYSMTGRYITTTGTFDVGTDNTAQSLCILGLDAAVEPIPSKAVEVLKARQESDGGWMADPSAPWASGSDSNTTAMAIQALIAAGEDPASATIRDGLTFLQSLQFDDGGFGYSAAFATAGEASSTALVVQALIAAGEDPLSDTWTKGTSTPISFLLSLQQPDGQIYYQQGNDGFGTIATSQAIPGLVGRPFPYRSQTIALDKGIGWVQHNYNGSTGSFSGWKPGASIDAVLALACSENDLRTAGTYAKLPLDYFSSEAAAYAATSASAAGKMATGIVIAGGYPRDIQGMNLVISMTQEYSLTSGAYGTGSVWDQSWSMLGMLAAGAPLPPASITYLQTMQEADGGWGSVDGTALALQTLAATGIGENERSVTHGLDYLKATQNHEAGWGFSSDYPATSSSSTAFALQALAAYDQHPRDTAWTNTSPTSLTLNSPLDALMELQHWQGGFKGYSGNNDAGATYQAIPGLAACPLPAMPVNFIVSAVEGIAPFTVAFTNTSRVQEKSTWNFGDDTGNTSGTTAKHTYFTPGVYTVTLRSGKTNATDILTRPNYIRVHAPATAAFSAAVRSGTAPLTVTFNNLSTGDYEQSVWNFGDGQTSQAISPTHGYTAAGTYTVTLTVSGTGGIDTATKGAYITVETGKDEPLVPPPSLATRPEIQATTEALAWLRTQQQADGSYPGFSNNVGSSIDTLLAIGAANQDADTWRSSVGNSLLEYVRTYSEAYAHETAAKACKLTAGVAAAGRDPRNFDGLDLVSITQSYYDETTGAFGKDAEGNLAAGTNWDQAWCMLAYVAVGESVPPAAVTFLKEQVTNDGYWNYGPQMDYAHIDSTGLALQALIAAGESPDAPVISNAVIYLHNQQRDNGGFADSPTAQNPDPQPNVNSTAYAIQALIAVGEDPTDEFWKTSGLTTTQPVSFVLALQQTDGSFKWQQGSEGSNLMATQQAIPALLGKPFPYSSRDVVIRKGTQWMAGQQQADGSFDGYNPGATVDACLALAATNKEDGVNAQAMTDYLSEQASSYATGASNTGKFIACLLPIDEDPQNFGGMNLIETLQSFYDQTSGAYGSTTWDQAWAIIALKGAGADIPANAVEYLKSLQLDHGGWEFSAGMGADTDSTGLVLQALVAAGVTGDDTALSANGVIDDSLTYLRATQNNQGGWGYNQQYSDTSANSTAYAIQGILAAGGDPQSIDWSMRDEQGSNGLTVYTPQDALRGLQSSAGGFQGFSGENDPSATYQALPGVNEQSYPLQSDYATVQAAFSTTPAPAAGTTPLDVTFSNGSTGDYTTSQWAFGDGAESWLSSPTHTYTQAGIYTATLTISGPGGTATTTANIQVNSVVYLPVIER